MCLREGAAKNKTITFREKRAQQRKNKKPREKKAKERKKENWGLGGTTEYD